MVPKKFEVFLDGLGCFEAFYGVLISNTRFCKVREGSWAFL